MSNMAVLTFPSPTVEQLMHIHAAERELLAAGVRFDVGSTVAGNGVVSHEWCLDWSLKGAELREVELVRVEATGGLVGSSAAK